MSIKYAIFAIMLALTPLFTTHNLPAAQPENFVTQVLPDEGNTITALKQFKAIGWTYCIDPNVAFIWNIQSPKFSISYENEKGEIKERTYKACINSIGLKIQLAVKFNLIFIINNDFDFYTSNKVIELGPGIEFRLPLSLLRNLNKVNYKLHDMKNVIYSIIRFLLPKVIYDIIDSHEPDNELSEAWHKIDPSLDPEVTYVAFKNTSGGLLIISYPFGPDFFGPNLSSLLVGGNLSYVCGGTLTPLN